MGDATTDEQPWETGLERWGHWYLLGLDWGPIVAIDAFTADVFNYNYVVLPHTDSELRHLLMTLQKRQMEADDNA